MQMKMESLTIGCMYEPCRPEGEGCTLYENPVGESHVLTQTSSDLEEDFGYWKDYETDFED